MRNAGGFDHRMSASAESGPGRVAARPARWRFTLPRLAASAETAHRLIIVASLILPLAVLAGGGFLAWRAQIAQARIDLAQRVDLAHENLARVFETHRLLLRSAAAAVADASDADITAHERQLHERLASIVGQLPEARDLSVLDTNGRLLVSAKHFPAPRGANFADRDYFRGLAAGDADLAVGAVQVSRLDQQQFFAIAEARRGADGRFLGVILVTVSPSYFENYWVRNGLADETPDGTTMVLFRSDGQVPGSLAAADPAGARDVRVAVVSRSARAASRPAGCMRRSMQTMAFAA